MLSRAAQDQDVAAIAEWISEVSAAEFAGYVCLVRTCDFAALRVLPDHVLINVLAMADVGLFEVGERARALAALEGSTDE